MVVLQEAQLQLSRLSGGDIRFTKTADVTGYLLLRGLEVEVVLQQCWYADTKGREQCRCGRHGVGQEDGVMEDLLLPGLPGSCLRQIKRMNSDCRGLIIPTPGPHHQYN
jgi:hypothetical protein